MNKVVIIKFITEKKYRDRDAEKLRGYFGWKYEKEILFHNHKSKYEFLYNSPKIQYKIIDGFLSIVGINEGGDLLGDHIKDIEEIIINEEKVKVIEIEKKIEEFDLKIEEKLRYIYNLKTLWLALNQENYKKYRNQEIDLNISMRNNIIEFFKMCGVWADKEIKVKGAFEEHITTLKNRKILGFSGWFITNVELPNLIGLGKRKSIGFGTIAKSDD